MHACAAEKRAAEKSHCIITVLCIQMRCTFSLCSFAFVMIFFFASVPFVLWPVVCFRFSLHSFVGVDRSRCGRCCMPSNEPVISSSFFCRRHCVAVVIIRFRFIPSLVRAQSLFFLRSLLLVTCTVFDLHNFFSLRLLTLSLSIARIKH